MILHAASRSRRLGLPGLSSNDRAASAFARRLDDDYHWFRSLGPGGIEPIDAIVVGPGGTFAITMSGERGRFTRRNDHWYRWNRSTDSWVPWHATSITAARLAGRRLSLYLERAGLAAAVDPILMPADEMEMVVHPGEPAGIIVERSTDRVADVVSAESRLSQGQVDRIVALLDPRQPLPRLAQATPNG